MILNTKTNLDNAVELSKLFHVGFNFITAANVPKPSWKTNRKYKLTRGEWVKRYTDELTQLGVSFDTTTEYVMLDIDRGSKYHPYNDLKAFKKVCHTLEKVGLLSYDNIYSSESQGIHIYFWLSHAVNTFRLAALVHVTLINAGIDLSDGQLEQFPNPKAYGDRDHPTYYKPHRLPLQPNAGGMLLDRDGEVLLSAENLTHESMLAGFLRRAAASAADQDMELLERKLDWAYNKYKTQIAKYQYHHHKEYSQTAQEWKENLELTMDIGWTGHHQTNTLLPTYIAYGVVFLGLKGAALSHWIYVNVIATRGYNENCRHKHEIQKVIDGWVKNTERQGYYVEYCGFPARSGLSPHKVIEHIKSQRNEHNDNLIARTQQRLAETLAALTKLPHKLTDRIAEIVAKSKELFGQSISRNTLYKPEYKSIWNGSEIEATERNLAKNPTPPLNSTQTDSQPQNPSTEPKKIDSTLRAETQAPKQLSHTPPIYEIYVEDLLPCQLHHRIQLYCINLICRSVLSLEPQPDLPNPEAIESEVESLPTSGNLRNLPPENIDVARDFIAADRTESQSVTVLAIEEIEAERSLANPIAIGSRLRRNVERAGAKTYPALFGCEVISSNGLDWVVKDAQGCRWNVSHHALASGVWEFEADPMPQSRSVMTIAIEVRQRMADLPDELLLELLHHPERETIDWAIELTGELVAAESGEMVADLTANLSQEQKRLLWGVMSEDERNTVRAKIDRSRSTTVPDPFAERPYEGIDRTVEGKSVPTIIAPKLPLVGVGEASRREASLKENPPSLGTGSIVRTVTGLVGVIRHVFDSISKPFVVYHQELQRTIRYEFGDLRLLNCY
jgi:hypothetical protein